MRGIGERFLPESYPELAEGVEDDNGRPLGLLREIVRFGAALPR